MIPMILTKQLMAPCRYAYKFGIITNGLGIVRDITFYNKDFLQAHPDIVVEKKSDSPDEYKSWRCRL